MTWSLGGWVLAVTAALLAGLSKTGIGGLGMLAVVLFAQIMPAKEATGIVLPLLCCGDLAAVLSYRRHATWRHLWRLFPWTGVGVVFGYVALGRINEQQTRVLIGVIVLALVALHLWRRRRAATAARDAAAAIERGLTPLDPAAPAVCHQPPIWFAPMVGVLAGFTTLVANAAGPLMVIYLLAMRLPKLEFMGTGAVFFMLLNWFKVPFMVHLGLITRASLELNLMLAPAVFAGAWLGWKILHRIDQRLFENLALVLSVVAGAKLLIG